MLKVYAPSMAQSGGGGRRGGDSDGGDGGGGVLHSTFAIPLKLRRMTSPRMLQEATRGFDNPIDRTARPTVVKKNPIESRKPSAVK